MQKLNFQRSWRASVLGLTCLLSLQPFFQTRHSPNRHQPRSKNPTSFSSCATIWAGKIWAATASTFYETPNLDRLATRGMKFMNAHDSTDFTPVNERT